MLLRRGIRVGTPHEMEDIRAERKRSQAALRASELRLRQRMMRAVPVIRFISGAGNRYDLTYGAPRTAEQARQHARFLEEMRRGHKAIEQQVRGQDVASQVRGLNLLGLRAARRGPYGEPRTLKPYSEEARLAMWAPEPLPLAHFLQRYPDDEARAARAYLMQEGVPEDFRRKVADVYGVEAPGPPFGPPLGPPAGPPSAEATRAGAGEVKLTPADYAEIAGQVGQYGVLPRIERGEPGEAEFQQYRQSPEGARAMDILQRRGEWATREPTPEERSWAVAWYRANDLTSPRRQERIEIGPREYAMPNPLAGMRGSTGPRREYQRLEAATVAGQLERMGLAPEQIDRILAARYPGLGPKPYTGVPQTTEEIRRLERIAETPIGAAAGETAAAPGAAGAGGEMLLGGPAPLTPEQKARMAALETQKRLGELQAEEIVRKREQEEAQRTWEGLDTSALTAPNVTWGRDVVHPWHVDRALRLEKSVRSRMRTRADAKEFLRRYEAQIHEAIRRAEGSSKLLYGAKNILEYNGVLRRILGLARAIAEGREPPRYGPPIPDIFSEPPETTPTKGKVREVPVPERVIGANRPGVVYPERVVVPKPQREVPAPVDYRELRRALNRIKLRAL